MVHCQQARRRWLVAARELQQAQHSGPQARPDIHSSSAAGITASSAPASAAFNAMVAYTLRQILYANRN